MTEFDKGDAVMPTTYGIAFLGDDFEDEPGVIVNWNQNRKQYLVGFADGYCKYLFPEEIQKVVHTTGARRDVLDPLTSPGLAEYVGEFITNAQARVTGVGAEQYDDGKGRQKFEKMNLLELCDWADEELQDVAVYAAMLSYRIKRVRSAFTGDTTIENSKGAATA